VIGWRGPDVGSGRFKAGGRADIGAGGGPLSTGIAIRNSG